MKNFTEINRALAAKNTNPNSRVLHMAHRLRAGAERPCGWPKLVKHAWRLERFRQALNEGLATFQYIKLDGSLREAVGTLNWYLIPADDLPAKPTPTPMPTPNYAVIPYYDLKAQGWRSFRIEHLVSVQEVWRPVKEKRSKKEN